MKTNKSTKKKIGLSSSDGCYDIEQKATHTPTPEGEEAFAEITKEIEVFFHKPWMDIVRAVNSHEALLNEVKRAQVAEFMANGNSERYDEIGKAIAQAEAEGVQS